MPFYPKSRALVLMLVLGSIAAASPAARAFSHLYVGQGSPLLYRLGVSSADPQWTDPDWVPGSDWIVSTAGFGIGYGDGDDQTLVPSMQNVCMSVFVRAEFIVGPELPSLTFLELSAQFDDGFVAFLNGVEIGRSGLPSGPVAHDQAASSHEISDGDVRFLLEPSLLVEGRNVFAVQVHNSALGSSDLSFLPTLWAYDTPPPPAEITVGPFLQLVGRRSALVVWETDLPAPSVVAYGPTEILGGLLESQEESTRHEVLVEGLRPGSPLYYRVVSAEIPSPLGQIWPENDVSTPYRFVLFGDTRSDHASHAEVVSRILAEAPVFTAHSGDLVANGTSESDWSWFFDVESSLLRSVPLYPVLGNHEADGVRYQEVFVLPTAPAGTERYYAYTWATTGVVCLDLYLTPYSAGSDQYLWLEDTLAAWQGHPQVRLKVVLLHHGPYDSGPHGSHSVVRSDLVPLFERYGVAAVISGHDHTYERGTVNDVKYVVTGGGGAPLYEATGDWWTQVTESVFHYVLVEVEGPRATFTARRTDGSILDQFTVGSGLTECLTPEDCLEGSVGDCLPDEEGAWICLHGACLWNCTLRVAPLDASVSVPDAQSEKDATTPPPDAGGAPPERLGQGCACSAGSWGGRVPFCLVILLICWCCCRHHGHRKGAR